MADDLDAFYAEIATVEAQVTKTAEHGDKDGAPAPPQDGSGSAPSQENEEEQLLDKQNQPSSTLGMLPPPPVPPPSAGAPGALPPPPRPPPTSRPAAVISSKPVIAAPPQPATLATEEKEINQPGTRPLSTLPAPPPPPSRPPPPTEPPGKKVGLVRSAAGERWIDPTLSEWPDNDFRIFVGNLAPEVTDAMLVQAFGHYESFNKARVVRNPKTKQSRGFGFVSFADAKHGAQALKEMHNQYIASRPCQLKRSKDDRTVTDKKGRAVKRAVNVKQQPPPDAKRHHQQQQQQQQQGGGYNGQYQQQGYQQDYSYGNGGGGGGGGGGGYHYQ